MAPAASFERRAGTTANTMPCHTAVAENRSDTGMEKATVAEKKRRSNQREIRLHCLSQTRCDLGTSQKSKPATKEPKRNDPMMLPTHDKRMNAVERARGGAQRRARANVSLELTRK